MSCAEVLRNINVVTKCRCNSNPSRTITADFKWWVTSRIAQDCELLLFVLQCEFLERNAVAILQCDEETRHSLISIPVVVIILALLVAHPRLPLHEHEAAETVPLCVNNELEDVHATVAVAVDFLIDDILVTAS